MIPKETFLQTVESVIEKLTLHKEISVLCEVEPELIDLHVKTIQHFELLHEVVSNIELSDNYINQFQNDVTQTTNFFPFFKSQNLQIQNEEQKKGVKNTIEAQLTKVRNQYTQMLFNYNFFKKLDFFKNNIVAIGANGSGKTTLSNDLKRYLPKNGVVISAQKVLIIPTFSGVSNFSNTNQKLQQSQSSDKSLKVTYSTESNGNSWQIMTQLGGEFQILLDNLLAERSVIRNAFFDTMQNGQTISNLPVTRLDKTLKIWNSLIQHRILECNDGVNITLKTPTSEGYSAHQMSDGEKVTLYLIAHILQAPESGFIIIDEPEMYLHKTILKKLWDILEQERQDCIFIYLTHDLDFATSRTTAKKVWIKSFSHPNIWEIENIPDNELPESLLLELLGSRKNILFCEGNKGSIDEKIYNILFPELTVTPVENCFAVINYTKAFNKLPNTTTKALGLIDSDHHDVSRIIALNPEKIYSFSMAEPENLFLDEDFLKAMAVQLLKDKSTVQKIKDDIILQLNKEIELQASNYVSAKINYYFKDSHVSKGNSLAEINFNYSKFSTEIKIQEWYDNRVSELTAIVTDKNYSQALSSFNNKGLKAIANRAFKIYDFSDRAIKMLQFQPETQNFLKKYFPVEITN